MPPAPVLHVDVRDAVATLRLDRPPANALDTAALAELREAALRLAADESVRAVVVTGTGRFFSAGLDLVAVFADPGGPSAEFARTFDLAWLALFGLPKPVVAAVNGHAIAGGAVLAACADVRIAAEGSGRVGLTEIQVGVSFPASVLELLRHACAGPHLAEVLCSGATYLPAEARERRLVDEVVPADALLERAHALAAAWGAHLPEAFAATKAGLRREALARMAAYPPGCDPVWAAWRSRAVLDAVAAYRERTLARKG